MTQAYTARLHAGATEPPHPAQTDRPIEAAESSATRERVRTIWLSDLHLGTRGCRAEALTTFLKQHECETLYLVGDVIDGWRLKSRLFWPQSHTDVIRRVLTCAKRGTRVVVVTGNHDEFLRRYTDLEREYPDAVFPGYRHGHELAAWFASADVFVFPSRTDTFGVVMLEAMACGAPVAAYLVAGPVDVVNDGLTGCLDDDLARATKRCLELSREDCVHHARTHDWRATARFFLDHTIPIDGDAAAPGESVPADS